MTVRDRHTGPREPSRDLEPSARLLLAPGELTARRAEQRWRLGWRRILLVMVTAPVAAVLYFGISYADYMLKPTSETFPERSAE